MPVMKELETLSLLYIILGLANLELPPTTKMKKKRSWCVITLFRVLESLDWNRLLNPSADFGRYPIQVSDTNGCLSFVYLRPFC